MNVIMLGNGNFVEVQGTAEGDSFSESELHSLISLAKIGINQIFTAQRKALEVESEKTISR